MNGLRAGVRIRHPIFTTIFNNGRLLDRRAGTGGLLRAVLDLLLRGVEAGEGGEVAALVGGQQRLLSSVRLVKIHLLDFDVCGLGEGFFEVVHVILSVIYI